MHLFFLTWFAIVHCCLHFQQLSSTSAVQTVQNTAACLVTSTQWLEYMLRQLHWYHYDSILNLSCPYWFALTLYLSL